MDNCKFKLNNGLDVRLSISRTDHEYKITAINDKDGIVGTCEFSLYNHFMRPFICEREMQLYLKNRDLDPSKLPNQKPVRAPFHEDVNYCVINNKIHISDTQIYDFLGRKCELEIISVSNRKYARIGLGYTMISLMEKYCKKLDVIEIYGNYIPNGELGVFAHEFYKRNGFEFYKDDFGYPMIRKTLQNENYSSDEKI